MGRTENREGLLDSSSERANAAADNVAVGDEEKDSRKNKFGLWLKAHRVIAIVAACLVVAGVAFAVWHFTHQGDSWYDGGMTIGSYEGKSQAEIQAALDAQVKEGEMNITCAPIISVDANTGDAEVRMENIAANHVDQKFTIKLDDGTVLYESGAIAPGNHLQTVVLDPIPSVGTHQATVTFQGYDRDTHKAKGGTAAFTVQLTVG